MEGGWGWGVRGGDSQSEPSLHESLQSLNQHLLVPLGLGTETPPRILLLPPSGWGLLSRYLLIIEIERERERAQCLHWLIHKERSQYFPSEFLANCRQTAVLVPVSPCQIWYECCAGDSGFAQDHELGVLFVAEREPLDLPPSLPVNMPSLHTRVFWMFLFLVTKKFLIVIK